MIRPHPLLSPLGPGSGGITPGGSSGGPSGGGSGSSGQFPAQSVRPASSTPAPTPASQEPSKIRPVEQRLMGGHHQESWQRKPNATGAGASHVRSFHCKLTGESLEFLDKQINEWLDQHPEYEVKFSCVTVGDWTGKLKEPNLIVQVWV